MLKSLRSKIKSIFKFQNKGILSDKDTLSIISSLKGSSKECLCIQVARSVNSLIIITTDKNMTGAFGKNLKGFAKLLSYDGEIIPYFFSGINTSRFDSFIFNDKIRALKALAEKTPSIVVTSLKSLNERVLFNKNNSIFLQSGKQYKRDQFIRKLVKNGYERVDYVETPLEFAVRGGVIDIYGLGLEWPVRMEFFDDKIDLMKTFDPSTQRTIKDIKDIKFFYLDKSIKMDIDILSGLNVDLVTFFEEETYEQCEFDFNLKLLLSSYAVPECTLPGKYSIINLDIDYVNINISQSTSSIDRLIQTIYDLIDKKNIIYISSETKGSIKRIKNLIKEYDVSLLKQIKLFQSEIETGFCALDHSFALLTDSEIFSRFNTRTTGFKFGKGILSRRVNEFCQGDLVVHFAHGIGAYQGIRELKVDGEINEVIVVEYADQAKLYVPRSHFYLLEKYVGSNKTYPKLDKLGSIRWAKKKKAASEAIDDYAASILKLEAKRELNKGTSFITDLPEIYDFEHSFMFKETIDQAEAIEDIRKDLESKTSMNRLVLGDAGFGKTETAIRASFICALNGKQTAFLAPTTILAEQHFKTFTSRMADYPLRIEVLSRFLSFREQAEIVKDLKRGVVDIVIGTHRLVQKDVSFKDLGLLIIDEEQRFGVAHKNYLIQKNPLINILNLSATPIPRTLYLSLMGVRNMSSIMTPPVERREVETIIIKDDWDLIGKAIEQELKRNGQVFFVHNRIITIEKIFLKLRELVPNASFAVVHGRLPKKELKQIMDDFSNKRIDCLIATSIIESGLDLPNANTLIVHDADKFGLAELYQLRGRIGRFNRKAYAYFMINSKRNLDSTVKKRIDAISEFSKPGGGYFVALKDLEIRGAGNILGVAQSGHIAAIGFELYCKLLKDSVKTLKGEPVTPRYEVVLQIGDTGSIPNSYIPSFKDRFKYYKRIAIVESIEEIEDIQEEIIDKFGRLPFAVKDFILSFKIKCLCRKHGILKIEKFQSQIELTGKYLRKERWAIPKLTETVLSFIFNKLNNNRRHI